MSAFSCCSLGLLQDGSIDNSFPMISMEYDRERDPAQRQYIATQQQYFAGQQSFSLPNEQLQMTSQQNFRLTMDDYVIAQDLLPEPNQMMTYPPCPPSENDQLQYADQSEVLAQSSHMDNRTRNRAKRVRTQFTAHQLIQLETKFNNTKYLSRTQRIHLSQELNLTEKQIKVWYQNRRMKHKKETSYRRKRSTPSNPVQDPRQTPIYEHVPPFTFGTNTFEPISAFHQSIPNQLNTNLSDSETLLSLSDMDLHEFDIDELSNELNALE